MKASELIAGTVYYFDGTEPVTFLHLHTANHTPGRYSRRAYCRDADGRDCSIPAGRLRVARDA